MSTRNRFDPIIEPCSFFSHRNSGPWICTIVPGGIMPMIVAVPPRRSMPNACSAVTLRPIASNEYCTPPPVISITSPTASFSFALTTSVAPNLRASSSFEATMSIAMIRPAPAIAAPLMHESPTPPQPITATVLPGSTLAVWITAPTPVVTPQPINAARSSGISGTNLHDRMLVHEHLLGERREVRELAHRHALFRQARCLVLGTPHGRFLAQRHVTGQAELALAAEHG